MQMLLNVTPNLLGYVLAKKKKNGKYRSRYSLRTDISLGGESHKLFTKVILSNVHPFVRIIFVFNYVRVHNVRFATSFKLFFMHSFFFSRMKITMIISAFPRFIFGVDSLVMRLIFPWKTISLKGCVRRVCLCGRFVSTSPTWFVFSHPPFCSNMPFALVDIIR